MAKITFLLPDDHTLAEVQRISEEQHQPLEFVKPGAPGSLKETIDKLLLQGTEIIISRGFLAKEITRLTTVPVVELRLTRMEVYELLRNAKARVSLPCPRVAIVCSRNMLCDTGGLGELAGVDLVLYPADAPDDIPMLLAQAAADEIDAIVCGVGFARNAQIIGSIPYVTFHSGRESILTALRMAKQVSYTLSLNREYTARQQTLLDYTVNGLVLLDPDGLIQQINPPAEQMLRSTRNDMIGQSITKWIPAITPLVLQRVMQEGEEVSALRQKVGKNVLMLSVTPVSTEDGPSGAVLSITEGRQLEIYSKGALAEASRDPAIARTTFASLPCRSAKMQAVAEKARRYADFAIPVFLSGEAGTEKEELACCMYNASPLQDGDFVTVHCDSEDPAVLHRTLFGENGLMRRLRGVLYLDQVQALSPESQAALTHFLESLRTPERAPAFLWVIAASDLSLEALNAQEQLRPELSCVLSPLRLTIPPLRERPEDITAWAQSIFKQMQPAYGRYIHLTQEAWKALLRFSWPGNKTQLYGICQRILVEAPRRTVSEEVIRKLLPSPLPAQTVSVAFPPQSEEERLRQLLQLYGGSRVQTAKALGISTTTLWRRLKKYGLV